MRLTNVGGFGTTTKDQQQLLNLSRALLVVCHNFLLSSTKSKQAGSVCLRIVDQQYDSEVTPLTIYNTTMVIAIHTSDSCNTLVSLDNHHNASSKEQGSSCVGSCCPSTEEYRKTSLCLPIDELDFSEDSQLDSSYGFCSCERTEQRQSLYLPTEAPVDEYLQRIPTLRDSCDELLSCNHIQFTEASAEKLIYVHQGELAHALASQCDVLVSDRATTCHIMALRSTSADSKEAMASLTHIDSDQYESCVREMIQAHKRHHGVNKAIDMDIHVMGGFVDEEGHSQKISNWLMHLLADIAAEEAASIQMTLKTCAISSMNDNGFQCPVGRGMAIHLTTGRVFLAKASTKVLGPHIALRNARLWSAGEDTHHSSQLQLVHTTTSNEIIINPFAFQALPGMDKLIALPDEILLEYTSTSPSVEEEDFCSTVRATLRFLLEVPSARIFGRLCDRTLRFARHSHSNEWMLMA